MADLRSHMNLWRKSCFQKPIANILSNHTLKCLMGMRWTCVRALNLWALHFSSKCFTPHLSFQADAYILLNTTTALGLFDKEVLLGLFKDSSCKVEIKIKKCLIHRDKIRDQNNVASRKECTKKILVRTSYWGTPTTVNRSHLWLDSRTVLIQTACLEL